MLTDLQREIRRILTGLAEWDEFALAGGAARTYVCRANRRTARSGRAESGYRDSPLLGRR